MNNENQQPIPEDWLKGLESNEVKGFAPEEMLACPKCARSSPPTRLKCMYCGADIPVPEGQTVNLHPGLRKMELWENGHNVILIRRENASPDLKTLASILKLETETLKSILAKSEPLPLARVESAIEAESLSSQLNTLGLSTKTISDEQMQTSAPTPRLREMRFADGSIFVTLFNTGETMEIPVADLRLIVNGIIIQKRVEMSEKLKIKKNAPKSDGVSETGSDELLIDIFSSREPLGYRIDSSGFDFSCLGADKGLTARDNMPRLAQKLAAFAPNAKVVNSYKTLRAELGTIWPLSEINDSKGVEREGLGTFKRKTSVSINNTDQFTRYARMQWHLL